MRSEPYCITVDYQSLDDRTNAALSRFDGAGAVGMDEIVSAIKKRTRTTSEWRSKMNSALQTLFDRGFIRRAPTWKG